MAIITSKKVGSYTDQHSPIILEWNNRTFDFQDKYVISVNKDLNSQLLEFLLGSQSYDGVDLSGTNCYADYIADWSIDGVHKSQGSMYLGSPKTVGDSLKYQWLLDQRQTYNAGKVMFGLRFQMEQDYNTDLFVDYTAGGTDVDMVWHENTWFLATNYGADVQPANYILALIRSENEFKEYIGDATKKVLTIGNQTSDNNFTLITGEPYDWVNKYTSYYIKTNGRYERIGIADQAPVFEQNKYYKKKYTGLDYSPAYVLRTAIGIIDVQQGVDVNQNVEIPVSDEGEFTFKLDNCVMAVPQILSPAMQVQALKNMGLEFSLSNQETDFSNNVHI